MQTTVNIVQDSLYQGLPSHPIRVNGYFYACISRSNMGSRYMNAFAAFSYTKKNLSVNYNRYGETNIVDTTYISSNLSDAYAGYVKFNGGYMNFLNIRPATYILALAGNFEMQPTWSCSGRSSFNPFETVIVRGFPVIKPSTYNYSIEAGKDFTILLDSTSNYDSLSIEIKGNLTYKQIIRRVAPLMKKVTFTTGELVQLKHDPNGLIIIRTYNYSYKLQESQLYLFELANKCAFNYVYLP